MKKNILLGISLSVMVISSCGKKTLVCKDKSWYTAREAKDNAGLRQEQEVYHMTIGETVYDVNTKKMEKYTKEYIEQRKIELEADNFECNWE